jgi:hypothetical protein
LLEVDHAGVAWTRVDLERSSSTSARFFLVEGTHDEILVRTWIGQELGTSEGRNPYPAGGWPAPRHH